MNQAVTTALQSDQTIDITTIGRKSGQPRRIEIWFHNVDDRLFITGTPGRRDWYANLVAHPKFTFHLKQSVQADLPAEARPIVDPKERRDVLGKILRQLDRADADLDKWIDDSPLVEVTIAE